MIITDIIQTGPSSLQITTPGNTYTYYFPYDWTNPTGSSPPDGAQGPQGEPGDPTKTAILPVKGSQGENEYVELICVEMPEVRFEDIVYLNGGNQGDNRHIVSKEIDDYFLQSCEIDTIKPVSVMTSIPIECGAYVENNKVFVEILGESIRNQSIEITVTLSAIRKGRKNRRFATHTKEEMEKNRSFWNSWKN